MIRPLIAILALFAITPGCKTSSKFAPLAFWRPQAVEPSAGTEPDGNPSDAYFGREMSPPLMSNSPPQLPPAASIPPAPSFPEPRPTPAPPNLFPMQ